MTVSYEVLGFYAALVVWAVLLGIAVKKHSYRTFLGFGIVILLFLNVRYLVTGSANGIANFIGIYDVFDNIGLGRNEGAAALAQCPDNACTVWGDRYVNHQSWGVAFYDRFANGSTLRNNLLYAHISFNTIAFVLMHYQLFRPGTGANRARHRLLGRVSFGAVSIGTFFALWLSTEHGEVSEYGGNLAMLGFWSMSAFVYVTAIMGVVTIRRGDHAAHRRWMIRFAGSMWGAFWLFRVMLVVTGPLLRNNESVSLLISIWFSAPLGIVIAEAFRRRSVNRPTSIPRVDVVAAGR